VQDATVKLWVRRRMSQQKGGAGKSQQPRSWFRFNAAPSPDDQSFSWNCRLTFEPKSEAVRDIRWSPFHDDSECHCLLCLLCPVVSADLTGNAMQCNAVVFFPSSVCSRHGKWASHCIQHVCGSQTYRQNFSTRWGCH
jgi:hypothetical protein